MPSLDFDVSFSSSALVLYGDGYNYISKNGAGIGLHGHKGSRG